MGVSVCVCVYIYILHYFNTTPHTYINICFQNNVRWEMFLLTHQPTHVLCMPEHTQTHTYVCVCVYIDANMTDI